MSDPKMMLKMVVVVFVLIAVVLLSLVVFDALSFDEVTDNLGKLAAVMGIVVVGSAIIGAVQRLK